MPETPTLGDVISAYIESNQLEMHTALPGEIQSYDAGTQTASVRPAISRAIFDKDTDEKILEELPIIPNVPVCFPGTGAVSITWPVSSGDTGLLVFCERNIGQWQETGERGDPGDVGCHTLDGAVFYPGLRHKGNASADTDGSALVIGAGQIKIGSSAASEAAVLGNQLLTFLNSHTHSGVMTGGGNTGPVVAPATASLLSSKVTVE